MLRPLNPKLEKILEELKRAFHSLYGQQLSCLVLFGSQARGDSEFGSDIDVLVVLKGDIRPPAEIRRTIDIVADLSLENDEVISCVFMNEDRYHNGNSPLLLNIRREGVLL